MTHEFVEIIHESVTKMLEIRDDAVNKFDEGVDLEALSQEDLLEIAIASTAFDMVGVQLETIAREITG